MRIGLDKIDLNILKLCSEPYLWLFDYPFVIISITIIIVIIKEIDDAEEERTK